MSFRLEHLDHPALSLARELLEPGVDRGLHPVDKIKDRPWLKVKKNRVRWRAVAHVIEGRPWIGAAGWREEGSPDDFYQELEDRCEAAAKGLHGQKYSSDWLLPGPLDQARLRAELEYRRQNVEPVERLRDLLDKATSMPDQTLGDHIGGDLVELTAEVDADGVWLTLDIDPAPGADVLRSIEELLGGLDQTWDIEILPNGRCRYFTVWTAARANRAAAWTFDPDVAW